MTPCRREAQTSGRRRLGRRNRVDGTVEAVFEGSEAAVAQCVAWCRQGPPRAEVTGLDVTEEDRPATSTFRVR